MGNGSMTPSPGAETTLFVVATAGNEPMAPSPELVPTYALVAKESEGQCESFSLLTFLPSILPEAYAVLQAFCSTASFACLLPP